MVPAALPAFSAPTGVSVVPSLARSAAESSAAQGTAIAMPAASASQDLIDMTAMVSPRVFILWSERIAERDGIEVAVLERVRGRAEARGLRGRHAAHVGAAVGAAAEKAR